MQDRSGIMVLIIPVDCFEGRYAMLHDFHGIWPDAYRNTKSIRTMNVTLSVLHEKNLLYFSFFLHYYELQLNKRIISFLGVDGSDLCDRPFSGYKVFLP